MTDRQGTGRTLATLAVALAATPGLLLALGWSAGEQRAASRDAEMRERLLRQAVELEPPRAPRRLPSP